MDLKIDDPLLSLLTSVRNEEFLQKEAKVTKVGWHLAGIADF
jgi:hypothetical protein